jgi:hypothetical protein
MQTQQNKGVISSPRKQKSNKQQPRQRIGLAGFIEDSGLPPHLVKGVIKQTGHTWVEFKDQAEDMRRADAGWSGFTYYSDTVPFAQKHRNVIREHLRQFAEDCGIESWMHVVAGFNCLDGVSVSEIEDAFHNNEKDGGDMYVQIYNALAWYALEVVTGAVCDWLDR